MYAIPTNYRLPVRTNAALREYARMEYGRDEVAWFLASIRRSRRIVPHRTFRLRFGRLRAQPVTRAVPHKGTPRLPRPAAPSPR